MGETEWDLTTGKKYSLINHLTCCSFEKKFQTFYYFLLGIFKTFSRIQDHVRTL